jgi:hypothetical protein
LVPGEVILFGEFAMVNSFMQLFYRDQAAALDDAREVQAELVLAYTTRLANSIPTPTQAEMDSIAAGNVVVLAGDGTPPTTARNLRPPHRNVRIQRHYATKS